MDGAFPSGRVRFLDGELGRGGRVRDQGADVAVAGTAPGDHGLQALDPGGWLRRRLRDPPAHRCLDRTEPVVVYRKRVSHRSRKNFQLNLFSPDDGHCEYSAAATNKTLQIPALWHFMAGRGAHERSCSELESHFGFAAIPTNHRNAITAWHHGGSRRALARPQANLRLRLPVHRDAALRTNPPAHAPDPCQGLPRPVLRRLCPRSASASSASNRNSNALPDPHPPEATLQRLN
jgi:hypothetical protein